MDNNELLTKSETITFLPYQNFNKGYNDLFGFDGELRNYIQNIPLDVIQAGNILKEMNPLDILVPIAREISQGEISATYGDHHPDRPLIKLSRSALDIYNIAHREFIKQYGGNFSGTHPEEIAARKPFEQITEIFRYLENNITSAIEKRFNELNLSPNETQNILNILIATLIQSNKDANKDIYAVAKFLGNELPQNVPLQTLGQIACAQLLSDTRNESKLEISFGKNNNVSSPEMLGREFPTLHNYTKFLSGGTNLNLEQTKEISETYSPLDVLLNLATKISTDVYRTQFGEIHQLSDKLMNSLKDGNNYILGPLYNLIRKSTKEQFRFDPESIENKTIAYLLLATIIQPVKGEFFSVTKICNSMGITLPQDVNIQDFFRIAYQRLVKPEIIL